MIKLGLLFNRIYEYLNHLTRLMMIRVIFALRKFLLYFLGYFLYRVKNPFLWVVAFVMVLSKLFFKDSGGHVPFS